MAELLEFQVVEVAVRVGLGDVLRQDRQFAHAVEGLGDLLQETVLDLGEGDGVADIRLGGVEPGNLGVEPG